MLITKNCLLVVVTKTTLEKLIKDPYNRNMALEEAEKGRDEFFKKLDILRAYPTKKS